MKKWISLSNYLDKINVFIAIFSRYLVILMLVIGVWNVIGRYVGVAIGQNLSSNILIEAQWYLFDCIFLLGLSWTLQTKGHVRVDVLQNFWKEEQRIRIELLGIIFLLLPFAIGVTIISISPSIESWRINELSPDPNGLPRYLIKTIIPLGFLLLTIQGVSEYIKEYYNLKSFSNSKKLSSNKLKK